MATLSEKAAGDAEEGEAGGSAPVVRIEQEPKLPDFLLHAEEEAEENEIALTAMREVETNVRFSHSTIWSWMRAFYEREGPSAWDKSIGDTSDVVPSYVTSNAHIANQYAKVVVSWLRDCLLFRPPDRAHSTRTSQPSGSDPPWTIDHDAPLYIIEIGAGSGSFGYLFLVSLFELREFWPKSCLATPFVFIMTDSSKSNVEAYKRNERLRPFVESGCLDFAVFDAELDMSLRLEVSHDTLDHPRLSRNPTFAIANYLFDTTRADNFRVIGQGRIQEGLLTLTSEQSGPDTLDPSQIRSCRYKWEYEDIPNPRRYYTGEDSDINFLLELYANSSELSAKGGANILVPVGAFRVLRALHRLSGGRLVVLAGDKGLTGLSQFRFRDPVITKHGSFSLVVNFHAVSTWITTALQGYATLGGPATTSPPGRLSSAEEPTQSATDSAGFSCLLGLCAGPVTRAPDRQPTGSTPRLRRAHNPRTRFANTHYSHATELTRGLSPEGFFHVKKVLESIGGRGERDALSLPGLPAGDKDNGGTRFKLGEIISLLRLCSHDPTIFKILLPRTVSLLKYPRSPPQVIEMWRKMLVGPILSRVFPVSMTDEDLFFCIGSLLLKMNAHEDAKRPLRLSLLHHGESVGTFYNLGVLYFCLAKKSGKAASPRGRPATKLLETSVGFFRRALALSGNDLTRNAVNLKQWIAKIERVAERYSKGSGEMSETSAAEATAPPLVAKDPQRSQVRPDEKEVDHPASPTSALLLT